jgi:membrane peptidoglycan carboxypeptidase
LAPLLTEDSSEELDVPKEVGTRGLFDRLSGLFSRDEVQEPAGLRLAELPDVLVDDRMHLETLIAVQSSLTRRELLLEAAGHVDLYDPDVLYWHQDFRVLLALRYVSELGSQLGIRSTIRPVLSLPLGASEITLEEAVSVYGGITSGKAWSFPGRTWQPGAILGGVDVASPAHPSLLIAEIQDVDGQVIYRAEPRARLVTSESSAAQTSHILRNVVLHGTGRRAKRAVLLRGSPVPLGGKTGTTNDFKNAAFLGFAPVFDGESWTVDHGFFVGAYVGYDDNRAMSNGRIRLAGASGALPAWITTIRGLSEAGLLGEPDAAPAEPWELVVGPGLTALPVDEKVGLPIEDLEQLDSDTDGLAPSDTVVWVPMSAPPSGVMHVQFEDMPRLDRVAPSTREAVERARRRREVLERLQQKPSIWDEI